MAKVFSKNMCLLVALKTKSRVTAWEIGQIRVSEWVSEYEVRFVLDQHADFDFYSAIHWNKSPRKDMSLHSETLFALSPQYCLLSGEATNTNFIVFSLNLPGFEPTIYRSWGEHANQLHHRCGWKNRH